MSDLDEVEDLIQDYKNGDIVLETELEDRLNQLDKETLSQYIRLKVEKGVL